MFEANPNSAPNGYLNVHRVACTNKLMELMKILNVVHVRLSTNSWKPSRGCACFVKKAFLHLSSTFRTLTKLSKPTRSEAKPRPKRLVDFRCLGWIAWRATGTRRSRRSAPGPQSPSGAAAAAGCPGSPTSRLSDFGERVPGNLCVCGCNTLHHSLSRLWKLKKALA